MTEKTKITFTHADGREIVVDVKVDEKEMMTLNINLGEEGMPKDETGLHITLFNAFMNVLKPPK